MSESKLVKKSITIPEHIANEVKKYSVKEKRSFSAQISLWLEEKLNRLKDNERDKS